MLIIISPAKTLDFSPTDIIKETSQPPLLEKTQILVNELKKYKAAKLARLMNINPKLAQLNFERYQEWELPFTTENAKQAILTFKGDVYNGLQADSMSEKDFAYAQQHLRILSGLYGVVKPLDLIQAYRLEMGTPVKFRKWKNLYNFWGNSIASLIISEIEKHDEKIIINLASKEYFKSIEKFIQEKGIRIITPDFKENKNGEYKFIHILGKRARGLMTRFIIDTKITDPEEIKLFDYEDYFYNDRMSAENNWVFTRGLNQD
ncbi:MAG: peroxide stress protein YaaA [Bacteroidales bacterium]